MKLEQILDTYDASYAREYDETFLTDVWTQASVAFQLRLLQERLQGARNWLDVACGTGWVLSRFPEVRRAGLDISAPMLEAARRRNPGCEFVQGNFRDPYPPFNERFDLVSCMWWAYCMAETISEVRQLVARLADWTSPAGTVVLPLCNPNKFDRHNTRIPYIDPLVPGRCMITGVTWSWIQENGKRHDDVMSPQVDHMMAMFRQHFADVRVVEGPLEEIGEGWRVQDVLLASRKRATPEGGDLFPVGDGPRAGVLEWLLGVTAGARASLRYPVGQLSPVRITMAAHTGPESVQASKTGYDLLEGHRYRLRFRARADSAREIGFGASLGDAPWSGLGLYDVAALAPAWSQVEREFTATATTARARVHFDLGASDIPVELAEVEVVSVS